MLENPLETAVFYTSLGCSVFPLKPRDKVPAVPHWKPYQERQPSRSELVDWFGAESTKGIAIVCGAGSENLTVRDFDVQSSYDTWAADHPEAADLLPTVSTSRGAHVYFRTTDRVKSGNVDDGEIKSDGTYVVAPPSWHESGIQYTWTHPFRGDDIPTIDPVAIGLITPLFLQLTQVVFGGLGGAEGGDASISVDAFDDLVTRAIRRTIPTGWGERNRCIFELVRNLKAIDQFRGCDADACYPVFVRWFRIASRFIKTQDFNRSWRDFRDGWRDCKVPTGALLFEVSQRADESKVPVRVRGEKLRRLAAICVELQSMHGNAPFYLDCRSAGKLLGVSHVRAYKLFVALCESRMLEKVSTGSWETRKSNEYRILF